MGRKEPNPNQVHGVLKGVGRAKSRYNERRVQHNVLASSTFAVLSDTTPLNNLQQRKGSSLSDYSIFTVSFLRDSQLSVC